MPEDNQPQEPKAGDQPQEPQAQPQQQPQQPQAQPNNDGRVPAGYVPVSEVAKERNKYKETSSKLSEAEAKIKSFEQRDAKRGFLREALGQLGQNFTIANQADLESVVEALSFDEATPDNTKGVIAKLVEQAKRPVKAGPATPMFGGIQRDTNKPAEGDSKHPLWERMQARRKQAGQ